MRNYYVSGQNNIICDSCGFKVKIGETRTRWDGFQVCKDCWEPRHPQDFVRTRQDKISVPIVRPRPTDVFVPQNLTEAFVEVISVRDNPETAIDRIRDTTDTQTQSDIISILLGKTVSDTQGFTENISAIVVVARSLTDTQTITETLTPRTTSSSSVNGLTLNGASINA